MTNISTNSFQTRQQFGIGTVKIVASVTNAKRQDLVDGQLVLSINKFLGKAAQHCIDGSEEFLGKTNAVDHSRAAITSVLTSGDTTVSIEAKLIIRGKDLQFGVAGLLSHSMFELMASAAVIDDWVNQLIEHEAMPEDPFPFPFQVINLSDLMNPRR